jgi:hypothetical protein
VKDRPFQIGKTANSDNIECLWSFADMIDSDLSMSNTIKKDVVKAKKFMDFLIHTRKFSFQIKKINVVTLHAVHLNGYQVKNFQR